MIRYLHHYLASHEGPVDALHLLHTEPPANRSSLFLGLLEMASKHCIQVEQSETVDMGINIAPGPKLRPGISIM